MCQNTGCENHAECAEIEERLRKSEEKSEHKLRKTLKEASSLDAAFRLIDGSREKGKIRVATLAERRLRKLAKEQPEMINHKKVLEEMSTAPSLELVFRAIDRAKKRNQT